MLDNAIKERTTEEEKVGPNEVMILATLIGSNNS
jgi:hypothetical protein